MNDTEHQVEELPALLHGELPLESMRRVTTHLRSCDACRRELVEIAVATGALARVDRQGLVDGATPTLPPLGELSAADDDASELGTARRRRHARWLVPVAAAVVALIVATGTILLTRDSSSPKAPTAEVALVAVGKEPAHGEVTMSGKGSSRTMVVSTDLTPAPGQAYYEVWLLDTRTNGMVAVGVLPTSGTAHFTLPSDLLERYDAIDLSLQPDNGKTTHSSDSVLRAKYA